jgi:hypothetical protein
MRTSESIKEIATALCKFQAEVKNPSNSAVNPFFKSKYAPLNEILNDVRPLLAKHGLSVLQMPSSDGQDVIVTTLLMHTSGEWIESCPLTMRPVKNDPQGIGSTITYGRRYALSAILGISSEDDDDGNEASNRTSKPQKADDKAKSAPKNDKPVMDALITEKAMKALHALGKEKGMSHDDISHLASITFENIESLNDLTEAQARQLYAKIKNMPTQEQEAVGV